MTAAEVRALVGETAFPTVWERVTRLREKGCEPRVFLDAQGDIVIEVTAVLSEGPTSDYEPAAAMPLERARTPLRPAEARSAASDPLTLSEAVALLPDTPKVHTWKNDGLGVFPGYLRKAEVIQLMQDFGVKRAPAAAQHLTHGLLIEWAGVKLFVQTKETP